MRALNVPKHALSIFLMMIPLASAALRAGDPVEKVREPEYIGKPTAEQKRKVIKAHTMKDGPRSKQTTVVSLIWLASLFFASAAMITAPEGNNQPVVREYNVQVSEDSSKEIQIARDVDMTYCPVWIEKISWREIILSSILVIIPVVCGPILTCVMEVFCYCKKNTSKTPHPHTPSKIRYWVIVILYGVIIMATYLTNMCLAEWYMPQFKLSYFHCLVVKYVLGNIDIMLIPLLIVTIDNNLREGLVFIFYAKKRGMLSKATSTCTSL